MAHWQDVLHKGSRPHSTTTDQTEQTDQPSPTMEVPQQQEQQPTTDTSRRLLLLYIACVASLACMARYVSQVPFA